MWLSPLVSVLDVAEDIHMNIKMQKFFGQMLLQGLSNIHVDNTICCSSLGSLAQKGPFVELGADI